MSDFGYCFFFHICNVVASQKAFSFSWYRCGVSFSSNKVLADIVKQLVSFWSLRSFPPVELVRFVLSPSTRCLVLFCFVFNICGFYTPTFVYKYGRASRACAESGDREGGRRTIYECACFSVQLVLYLRPFRAFTVVFIVVTQISEFVRRFPNLENARNFTKFLKFRPLTHEYRWLNITVYICFCFPSSNDFRTDTVEIGSKVH